MDIKYYFKVSIQQHRGAAQNTYQSRHPIQLRPTAGLQGSKTLALRGHSIHMHTS